MPNFKRHLKQLLSQRKKPEMSFTVSMKIVTTSPLDLYRQEGSPGMSAEQRWEETDTDKVQIMFMRKEKCFSDV